MYDDRKFRGWDKENKRMIPIRFEHIDGEGMAVKGDWNKVVHWENLDWMQYIGWEDKKDIEIYFGDIIQFRFYAEAASIGYEGTALITRTGNNGAGIMYDFKDDDRGKCFAVSQGGVIEEIWDDPELWDVEVIGNIYEDPELLT